MLCMPRAYHACAAHHAELDSARTLGSSRTTHSACCYSFKLRAVSSLRAFLVKTNLVQRSKQHDHVCQAGTMTVAASKPDRACDCSCLDCSADGPKKHTLLPLIAVHASPMQAGPQAYWVSGYPGNTPSSLS